MTLLASGIYRYWRDGALQAVAEPWRLSRSGQGLRLQGQRLVADRVVLDVEADYAGAVCTAMHVRWHGAKPVREVSYRHCGEKLDWSFAGGPPEQALTLPAGSRLFPLLRAATGPLLRQLAGAARAVVVPCIRHPAAAEFLQPLLSERRAILVGEQRYHYLGGEYGDEGCDCWLDERGLLQRYRWASPQGEWDVWLEELWTVDGFDGFVTLSPLRE